MRENIDLMNIIMWMSLFIISGSMHEFAHAFSAYILGDNTSKDNGRLTINPIAHIDIFGTIVFPLVSALSNLTLIGWMRSVPVNPDNFLKPTKGYAIVSFAGPFSNFMQAAFGLIVFKTLSLFNFFILPGNVLIFQIITKYVVINIFLMIFNLLPIPPLDGGGILRYFIPIQHRDKFDRIYRYGMIILYALLFFGLLDIIFKPFRILLGYIFGNIQDINFGLIILPFCIGAIIIYLFLRDDVNKFFKRKNITENYKKNEGEHEKNLIDTEKQNLIITRGLQAILKKVKDNIELNENEKDFIIKIAGLSIDMAKLCKEIDFSINDRHCNECEYFINCLLRTIKSSEKLNKTRR